MEQNWTFSTLDNLTATSNKNIIKCIFKLLSTYFILLLTIVHEIFWYIIQCGVVDLICTAETGLFVYDNLFLLHTAHCINLFTDADIFGPSIPTMMNINAAPELTKDNKMIPLSNFGIKCMSIGFLVSCVFDVEHEYFYLIVWIVL